MLTLIPVYDMIIMLGRSEKECPFFVPVIRAGPSGLPARASRLVGGVMTPPYRAFSSARHKKRDCTAARPHVPYTDPHRTTNSLAPGPARRK